MNKLTWLKPIGFISMFIIWIAMGSVLLVWPRDTSKSFSRHVSANKHAYFVNAIVQTAILPFFLLFSLKWLSPALRLPIIFDYLISAFTCGLLLTAVIPLVGNRRRIIHNFSIFSTYVLSLPILTILAFSSQVSIVAKVLCIFTIIFILTLAISSLLSRKIDKNFLVVQLLLMFFFDMSIWLSAYIGH